MFKRVIMSLAAGLLALVALQSPAAEAKGKGKPIKLKPHVHHVDKWRKWHAIPLHYIEAYAGGCDYQYWKWKTVGGPYWKSKYFRCRDIY